MSKIDTIDGIAAKLDLLRGQGRSVVQCHGVFDIVHPGHIFHLQEAKKQGDVLVVTITPDRFVNKGPGRPVFNQKLRAECLAALEFVDYIAVNNWPTAVEAIKLLKPNIYAKGSDYALSSDDRTGKILLETEAVESIGGHIFFTNGPVFSSTKILNDYFETLPEKTQEFLKWFKARYSADNIIGYLDKLRSLRVLVIGEAIVDQYCYCKPLGKSPKESIISTEFIAEENFAGGALAAANHIAGFADSVKLITSTSLSDQHFEFIKSRLRKNIELVSVERSCSIVKRRFVDPDFMTKIFEICYFKSDQLVTGSLETFDDHEIASYGMVLVHDFGHGFISKRLVRDLSEKPIRFLAVNAQTNSANVGFNLVTKYLRADHVCLDEPEIRLACHDRSSDLRNLMDHISSELGSRFVTVTRGHLGSFSLDAFHDFYLEIPVMSTGIVDRVGAGDAYLSIASLSLAGDVPSEVAGFLGNVAGAMKIHTVCNREPINPVDLIRFVQRLLK